MAAISQRLAALALLAVTTAVPLSSAAELPKESPFSQAGSPKSPAKDEPIEFTGVSTVGKKTMINLYNREAKRGFWVEEGKSSDGVSVVKYDSARDQVTIKRNGTEKTLSLRTASAVVSGPAVVTPTMQPISVPTMAVPPGTNVASTQVSASPAIAPQTPATTPDAQTRARQEEEARMLVSDLLEIGIAQRRAYEEAQRKAAGQTANPPAPGQTTTPPEAQPAPPAQAPAPVPPTSG